MAIVASGPMPGSTPTKVPSSAPTKHIRRLNGVAAVASPSIMFERKSLMRGVRYLGSRNGGQTGAGTSNP